MQLIASVLHLGLDDSSDLGIVDAYSLHRVVYSLYADTRTEAEKASGSPSGILYAEGPVGPGGRSILMLSDREPLKGVPSRKGAGPCGTVETRVIQDSFLGHDDYRFTIWINPTRCDRATGKIVPIKGSDNVANWFAECAPARWGFDVARDTLQVDRIDVLRFNDKAKRDVTLMKAKVCGRLHVTDRLRFQGSFAHGIGRGKSFGCGLLQIAPIRPVVL